ncbi:MAG: GWxTD domain-containing protein [bacterium]
MYSHKKFRKIFQDTLLILIVINTIYCSVPAKAGTTIQKKDSAYLWLLKECNQEVFTKTFEHPFLALLNKALEEEYLDLDNLEQKKTYIEYFWKKHNPNPLSDENEYLQNFLKRCDYVKEHFSCEEPPYFDDRGTYYLKYGEPTVRITQHPQSKYADIFKDETVRNFLGSIIYNWKIGKPFIPVRYSVRGNETWVYQFVKDDKQSELVLHFVDEGSCYREVKSLDKAIISPRKIRLRYFYWADLLKERAAEAQSRAIFDICEEIWSFENDIDIAAYNGDVISGMHDVHNPHKKLLHIDNKLQLELEKKKSNVPEIVFTPEKAVQELLFYYDIVQFKGSQDATNLFINYFIPVSDNFISDTAQHQIDTVLLQYGCLFENEKLQQVVRAGYEKSYSLQKFSRINLPYLIGNMNVSLLPKEGRITLQVEDEETRRKGFIKQDMHLRDFSTQQLCLSDIQFSQEIKDSLYREFAPVRHLRGISVIPYPYNKIDREQQLFCYFEIYNIKTGGIRSQYEVSFEVTTDREKQGIVKNAARLFRKSTDNSISMQHIRAVEKNDSQELIGIDFSNLKKGFYVLSIRVTDTDNPGISAEVRRNIQIEGQ